MRDFGRRAAFAVVAIPTAGYIIWRGGIPFVAVLSLLSALGAWEFFRLSAAGGIRALHGAGIALAAMIPAVVHANASGLTSIPLAAGALAMCALFIVVLMTRVGQRPLSAISATVFGVLYTGGLFAFVYAIRYHRFVIDDVAGTALVGLPLVLTWATDTGGYVFGRAFGKKKLMPDVSPGKTVVGAIGGLVLATGVAALYVTYVLHPRAHLTMSPLGIVVFGVIVSAAGQVGDLTESLLKREAGVKDSSGIIPGHGGVLDRFDSTLFIMPVAYVLIAELVRTAV